MHRIIPSLVLMLAASVAFADPPESDAAQNAGRNSGSSVSETLGNGSPGHNALGTNSPGTNSLGANSLGTNSPGSDSVGETLGHSVGKGIRAGIKGSGGQSATGGGPDNLASLLTLGLGLIAVIAIIFVCAWLVKRMNGLAGMNSKAMRIVSVMSVGARERIALIDVGGTQMLVGITPSAIRTLHVFDEPVVQDNQPGMDSDFAKRLQAMIGRNWPGRRPAERDEQEDRP